MEIINKNSNKRIGYRLSELQTGHVYRNINNDSIYTPVTKSGTAWFALLDLKSNIYTSYDTIKNKEDLYVKLDYEFII